MGLFDFLRKKSVIKGNVTSVLTLRKFGKRNEEFEKVIEKIIRKFLSDKLITASKAKELRINKEKSVEESDTAVFYRLVINLDNLTNADRCAWDDTKKSIQKELRGQKKYTKYALYNYVESPVSNEALKEGLSDFIKSLTVFNTLKNNEIFVMFSIKISAKNYDSILKGVDRFEKTIKQLGSTPISLKELKNRWDNTMKEVVQHYKTNKALMKELKKEIDRPEIDEKTLTNILAQVNFLTFIYKRTILFSLKKYKYSIYEEIRDALHSLQISGMKFEAFIHLTTDICTGEVHGCFIKSGIE